MAKCDHCGTTILFGGIHESGYRFCKAECRNKSHALLTFAAELPHDFVLEQAQQIHRGPCPKCQGSGPVDIHMKHTAISVLVMTHWRSMPILCCESCGTKAKLGALAFTTLLGWWGIPWGLIFTPVQIVRNLRGLAASINPDGPSPELIQLVRGDLASRLAHQAHQPRELAA